MTHTYKYEMNSVTADIVLKRRVFGVLSVLLILRKNEPFKGCWALPGGYVDAGESPLMAAYRELQEEAGVIGVPLALSGVYGEPGRDPRGPTITIAYKGEVQGQGAVLRAGDDAAEARWFETIPDNVAFDHAQIISEAL